MPIDNNFSSIAVLMVYPEPTLLKHRIFLQIPGDFTSPHNAFTSLHRIHFPFKNRNSPWGEKNCEQKICSIGGFFLFLGY